MSYLSEKSGLGKRIEIRKYRWDDRYLIKTSIAVAPPRKGRALERYNHPVGARCVRPSLYSLSTNPFQWAYQTRSEILLSPSLSSKRL
mmetsp:Transcript_32061/g.58743  ORF Transcript_32061/g.58743 Transcript_32061/m.58743 type:complete len:88 (+) Transcript_32061:1898-2161(+)